MAIDTENKRRSISGYSGLVIAPRADGTISAPDRTHLVGLFARAADTPGASTLQVFGHHAKRQGPQRRVKLS